MTLSCSSDEETSDESFPDTNLKAYDFEPVCIMSSSLDDEESAKENKSNSRIGNTKKIFF